MSDVVIGLVTLLVGAVFCFRGYLAMRVVIPIWGAFAGFMLGAGIASGSDGFLGSAFGWILAIALGIVFGLIAYLYYSVAVIIAMTAIGFVLGASVLVAFGVTWNWVIVLGGVTLAVILSFIAIAGDVPMLLLTVLTATAGASTIVAGLMLLFGVVELDDYDLAATTKFAADDWWWYVIYGGLVVAGIIAQLSDTDRRRASLREAWATGISSPPAV